MLKKLSLVALIAFAGASTFAQHKTATVADFVDGWTIGGGIEYAWHPSFIVGVDYQHIQLDLGTAASCDLCLIGIPIADAAAINGNADISLVTLRASYLFRPED